MVERSDMIIDLYNTDPTLASFYDLPPRRIAAYEATLTHDGEIRLLPLDCAAVHEDAPLMIDDTTQEADDAA